MNHSYNSSPSYVNESLYSLACAPNRLVRKYTGCIVNGVRFLTIERDVRCKTQNSGIIVEGNHGDDNIEFFGILTHIIHLDYVKGRHITVFKCEWFDLGTKKRIGIQKEGNITSIRVTGKWYENEPFIMADQARQVFYINDPKLGGEWRVVQPFQHRHIYDVDEMQNGAENIDEIQVHEEVYQDDHIDDAFDVNLGEIQSLRRENMNMEEIEQLITLGTPEVHEDVDLHSSEEDELDDTLVDYYSSDEDSQKISVSDDDSDDDNSSMATKPLATELTTTILLFRPQLLLSDDQGLKLCGIFLDIVEQLYSTLAMTFSDKN
ncbi:hypothetical protein OROMI_009448 [Orobanche minor]